MEMGVRPQNLLLCDSKGVLHEGRTDGLNEWKTPFLRKTDAPHARRGPGRRRTCSSA
jgi:malic enzyme